MAEVSIRYHFHIQFNTASKSNQHEAHIHIQSCACAAAMDNNTTDQAPVKIDKKNDAPQLVEAAIEVTGIRQLHIVVILLLCLANMCDTVESGCIGPVMLVYRDESGHAMSNFGKSMLSASFFVGMAIGSIICGLFSDRFGRRTSLLMSLTVNAVSGILSSFASTSILLIVARVGVGIGAGGSIPVIFAMAVEVTSSKYHGRCINAVATAFIAGSIYSSLLAYVILNQSPTETVSVETDSGAWRFYLLVCSFPSATALAGVFFLLPESPRWLVSKGKFAQAAGSLRKYQHRLRPTVKVAEECSATNKSITMLLRQLEELEDRKLVCGTEVQCLEEGRMQHATDIETQQQSAQQSKGAALLLHSPLIQPFCLTCIVWFLFSLCVYGIFAWAVLLFQRAHLWNALEANLIFTLGAVPGTLLAWPLMESTRITHERLVCVCLLGCAVMSALWVGAQHVAELQHSSGSGGGGSISAPSSWVQFWVLGSAVLWYSIEQIVWPALEIVSAERYPVGCRATALAICGMMGRLGSVAGQFVFAQNPERALIVVAVLSALAGVLAGFIPVHRQSGDCKSDQCKRG
jgi:MFS family permease